MSRFIGYSPVVTTSSYNTLKITVIITKYKVFNVCLLGKAMNVEQFVVSLQLQAALSAALYCSVLLSVYCLCVCSGLF
jgi:hypothetical protein